MARTEWFCDCRAYCRKRKQVSKSTYHNHKPYRDDPSLPRKVQPITGSSTKTNAPHLHHSDTPPPPDTPVEYSRSPSLTLPDQVEDEVPEIVLSAQEQTSQGLLEEETQEEEQPDAETSADPGSLRARSLSPGPDEGAFPGPAAVGPAGFTAPRRPTVEDVPEDETDEQLTTHIRDLKDSLSFIEALKEASLDADPLSDRTRELLRHPICEPLDISDPDLRLSIDLFLSLNRGSEEMYASSRDAILQRNPNNDILTYEQMQRKMCELTGVVPIHHDMCPNSCIAYMGPFSHLESCFKCGTSRWNAFSSHTHNVAQRQFMTIPLGPQLQALFRTREGATNMRYRWEHTRRTLAELAENDGKLAEYDDFFSGSDYLKAVGEGKVGENDICVVFSMDSAQLYESKQSDCWIYIWVIYDLSPDLRYKKKHVLPGGFIPGPNNPQHIDSFLFPGFHHLAAIQKEGLAIWDALDETVVNSNVFFALGTADGVGLNHLNGMCGHSGFLGCRTYCGTPGRHKDGAPNYYPALLKPTNYHVQGCDHDDIDPHELPLYPDPETYLNNLKYLLASENPTQYLQRRKETGISKPSLLMGLAAERMLGIPNCFLIDLMHLVALNLPDALLSLWRGVMQCDKDDDKASWDFAVLQGNFWKTHGAAVAKATPYLPGSFDRPPRNPAEKLSSGYKAWEFLNYIFGLAPVLLQEVLLEAYWDNFCHLVRGMRLLHQHKISSQQVSIAHEHILEFVQGYEKLYYQCMEERIHFCRQSIHTTLHLAPETVSVGPKSLHTQWLLERTIGNLGEEIKLHSNPYANLEQRGLMRSQVNALKAMAPQLDKDKYVPPRGAKVLANGFVLLHARDRYARVMHGNQAVAIRAYFESCGEEPAPGWRPKLMRWARLRLPNGQIARSAWKEKQKALNQVRMSRNVKITTGAGKSQFAEVQYYFRAKIAGEERILALISMYSEADTDLLSRSHNTICACHYRGAESLAVIGINSIQAVVAMVPLALRDAEDPRFFLVEKMGHDIAMLGENGGEQDIEEN